jgi:hypothetical protein
VLAEEIERPLDIPLGDVVHRLFLMS